jgi:hypothetical protein
MASTTIYEVKADLLTNLQAASALSGVQVTYGDPGGAARRESIFLGDVDSSNQIPESLSTGRRRRLEEYTLEVLVFVQSKAAGLQEAEQRAVVLAAAVEDVVADAPQLSGTVSGLMFVECSGMSMSSAEAGVDGPRVACSVNFNVKARLA